MGILVLSWVDAGVEHFREVGVSLTFCGLVVPEGIRGQRWAAFVPGAGLCEACNAGVNVWGERLRRDTPGDRQPGVRRH